MFFFLFNAYICTFNFDMQALGSRFCDPHIKASCKEFNNKCANDRSLALSSSKLKFVVRT